MAEQLTYADFKLPTDAAVLAVGHVTIAWSRLDSIITQWLATETQADYAVTYVLIGRLELRAKLDKLTSLFKLTGETKKRKFVADLRERLRPVIETRNLITHSLCVGIPKSDERHLVYLVQTKVMRGKGDFAVPFEAVSIKSLLRITEQINDLAYEVSQYLPTTGESPPSRLFHPRPKAHPK